MTASTMQIVRGPLAMSLPLPASMRRTDDKPVPIARATTSTTTINHEGAPAHG